MSDAIFPEQTPLYHALNAERYARRSLIEQVQQITNRKLLVYHTNIAHPNSHIEPGDVAPFQEMVYDCLHQGHLDVDLVIHSVGGDIDTAEKIVNILRKPLRSLRVIVPERAKSAATLIALAADQILMSDTSELGPIDPQIIIQTATGQPMVRPAQSFLDGLETIFKEVQEAQEKLPAYYPILGHLDPALIDFCHKSIQRAKQFAEEWLLKGMCANDSAKAKSIAEELCNVKKYTSHGAVIDHNEAQRIGLEVVYIESTEPLWEATWRLFTTYEVYVRRNNIPKVWETNRVAL